ncbi:MAG TPA: sodium:solute symporter family protein [Kofleriaceae bacterium]|nr:sodium:solute symporter family protein [Kofleriaceae bacterium]
MDLPLQTSFGALDWGIVVVYLAISVCVGFAVSRYVTNMTEYVAAGRGVRTALGVASLASSEMGLVTVMYAAQKGFTGGFAAFHIAVAGGVVALFVGLSGFIVARLRATAVLTVPEFYEQRFGRDVRVLGGVLLALGGILNMGLFLRVESMFIVGLTGIHGGSALTTVMMCLVALALLYTVFGGAVSDLVTDYMQFVVRSIGLLIACALAVRAVGWDHLFSTVEQQMGPRGFDPLAEGGFGAEYVLWMVFLGLVSCALWPTSLMRALSAESEQVVRRTYALSSIGFMSRFLLPYFLGICALVFALDTPELHAAFFPADGSAGASNLYALPLFLARILPTGVIGLVLAAMLAAFMSTYDTYLLCWSSVITQDVVAPLRGDRMGPRARILLTRLIMVAIGIYLVVWGLLYPGSEELWDYLAVSGAVYFSGAFALLVFGLYWKRASRVGALAALVCGLAAVLGLSPVQQALGVHIPSERVGLATIALTTAAMVLGSLLFPDRREVAA